MKLFQRNKPEEAGRPRRVILPLFSDTHGGNKYGLLSPETELQEYDSNGKIYFDTPKLNHIQQYIWELYSYHIEQVFNLAGDDEVMPEHDGDIAHGAKHIDETTMSVVVGVQKAIAQSNMRRWLSAPNVKIMRFADGTPAHDFIAGSMSYMVAEHLQAEHPDKDIKAVHHGLLDIDGFKLDYSHHGPPPGSRTWLKGNEARYYLRDRMLSEILRGRTPPDLYHRAHYHEAVIEEVRVNGHKSTIVITPSYSFPGAWTRQATRSLSEVTNGMIALEIEGGKLRDIHEFVERTDIRTRETV